LDAGEELQEEDTYVLVRRKKNMRKIIRGVVIREVSTKMSSGNLLVSRSFQSCAAGKRRRR
jgi:hypothetical protein